ncbi:hypothetical protein P22_2014 [Propionispora sp. 2/2-37]|uniref:hypothetical protein n=1 Tax=Propionispora sp. 2/2-37 TaxID=1677858 RepID=UPI0006C3629D|nr:hypothetical protein [Propionispora sp. 2/2-37]CUH95926.1 hypothetical protein P22_2014 [Propionispora sp. 2/2-37]
MTKKNVVNKELVEDHDSERKTGVSEVNITIRDGNVVRFEHIVRFSEEEGMYGDGI